MPVQYIPHPIRAEISDETATRMWEGIYQNNNLRPMMVILNVQFTYVNVGIPCRVDFQVDIANPPTTNQERIGYDPWAGASPEQCNRTLVAMVPPGYYYRAQRAIGGANVVFRYRWLEVVL